MIPTILFRESLAEDGELSAAQEFFFTTSRRGEAAQSPLQVIGRYSVLPYYSEVDSEVHLVNSVIEHELIASGRYLLGNYLKDITPKTWEYGSVNINDLPSDKSFVLKGKTNSMKFSWDTHMFAKDKSDIARVARNLLNDTFIRDQGILIREYVPLTQVGDGINGLPLTEEYRMFFFFERYVAGGYYWALDEGLEERFRHVPIEAMQLGHEAARLLRVPFVCIDVAKTAEGNWIVIEANDGQMSGLSTISPFDFYRYLYLVATNSPKSYNQLRKRSYEVAT